MNKFFEILDNLPIVRLLQIMALVSFVLSMAIFVTTPGIFEVRLNNLANVTMYFANGTVQPLMLLALAEIIKLMRKKK